MTDELKPCPFCGSTRVSIMKLSDGKNKFAICMNCKATSNAAKKVEDVKYLWNKRAERTAKVIELATRIYCDECGERIDDFDDITPNKLKYCPNCGARLEWE